MKTKRQFSSGGVLFKFENESPFFLLIKVKERWQLPKGLIDKGETPEQTAEREVFEETGCRGRIEKLIDSIEYFYVSRQENTRFFKKVYFFLMEYLSGDPVDHDWEVEDSKWLEANEAIEELTFKAEAGVAKKALEKLT